MENEQIDLVLSGEIDAFRYFLDKYKDMAFNISRSIVKDDHYAEEVVQNAFMKAFKGLPSFNKTATFKTWFYKIVVNESFQKLRKLKRNVVTLDIANIPESHLVTSEDVRADEYAYLSSAIQAMKPKESLALNLFYLEEQSMKEIQEVTGWSLANTKVILHRARNNLRALVHAKPTD